MDGYYGKKATVSGLGVSKKGSGPVLRETGIRKNQNSQSCKKLICSSSGKMNSTKQNQFGGSEKLKPWIPSFRSSSSKELIGGSSPRSSSAENSPIKSRRDPRKLVSSKLDTVSTVTDDVQSPHPDQKSTSNEVGCSSTTNQRNLIKKSVLVKQGNLAGPTISSRSKNISYAAKPGTGTSRMGLRNLKCDSVLDGCSSSDSTQNSKFAVTKMKSDEDFKGKKIGQSSSANKQISSSSNGVSSIDSRRAANLSSSTRRAINGNPRLRISSQGEGINRSRNEPAIIIDQTNEPEVPNIVNLHSSSNQNSSGNYRRLLSSYTRPGSSSSGGSHLRFLDSPVEGGGLDHPLINRHSLQRSNMNGIAEVLLALERIGQEEEFSYEQLLVLEANLYFNGLSYLDQHRDMRLDIDNMSYEELLALEDKMGTVSTALKEDDLKKCLESFIFKSSSPEAQATSGDDDYNEDVKCSICQEEYFVGDELGRLQCEHSYHLTCIQQWLRLKNWCPVCKIYAASSSPPTKIEED